MLRFNDILRVLIAFAFFIACCSSDNYTIVTGPRSISPPWFNPNPTPAEALKYQIRKGGLQLIYMRVIMENGSKNNSYVSAFGVEIDAYAQLVIPNSTSLNLG